MKMMIPNILLTGASGFVGRHVRQLLVSEGYPVRCLVRRPSGSNDEIVWDFRGPLPTDVPTFDILIHLAAAVNFGQTVDPGLYQVNTVATESLAEWACKRNASFVFASSISVHEPSAVVGHTTPVKPVSHYAMSKFLAEEMIRCKLSDYLILRIGGIYGLDGPEHLFLNRCLNQAYHSHVAPVVRGKGVARRNYLWVWDVARWIAALVREKVSGTISSGKTLYCGASEVLSVRDYATLIAKTLVGAPEAVYEDGIDGADCVIDADPAPFHLTRFEDFLQILKADQSKARTGSRRTL